MNKILIALVLAVVMSGSVFADVLLFYCDSEFNYGYYINKSEDNTSSETGYVYGYHKGMDKIEGRRFSPEWSIDYVTGWNPEIGRGFRINRKTLIIEYQNKFEKTYITHGQCSLIDNWENWIEHIENKRAEKTKGNKF